jgi:hypothetical protein
MLASSVAPRVAQLAVIAVTALSVGACGTSNNGSAEKPLPAASPTSSAPSPAPPPPVPPPPAMGKDHIEGLVQSVSGGSIHLRLRNGAATVSLAPSTQVTEARPAQLSDVTEGSCVSVRAAPAGAPGAISAQSVTISPAIDGKCLPPPEASSKTPPTGSPAPPSAAAAGVFGQVASVSGTTIVVNSIGPGGQPVPATVTVAGTTSYSNDAVTNAQAIENGKCMAAQGTESDGVLQATTISLQPCPPMGGDHHHHFHLPAHLPFHL